MCIVAIAWQLVDGMPLMLMSNRDEILDRPTLAAHQWQDMPVFAARDVKSGGTWLGFHHINDQAKYQTNNQLNQYQAQKNSLTTSHHTVSFENKNNGIKSGKHHGRWATVLNFRDMIPAMPQQHSRGQLITSFLKSDLSPMAFAKQIKLQDYAGFNLIIGDVNSHDQQAVLVNNRGYPPTALHAGLHVISNGQPDEAWFKCERLRTCVFQEVLPLISQGVDKNEWQKVAFDVLSDTLQAEDKQLPNTGASEYVEKALSSIFIEHCRLKNYGTRTQSVMTLSEKSKKSKNSKAEDTWYEMNLITKETINV